MEPTVVFQTYSEAELFEESRGSPFDFLFRDEKAGSRPHK